MRHSPAKPGHFQIVYGRRRLRNRRKNSSLPALIELVLARPVVSAGLIAAELKISQRAALGLVAELAIREVTGRGRYRAWGIV
ncbi:helix-turn-helix domain-containing protein [Mesorhizobium sp.]|uniref:helix-turn-helix domain-containing protein n=1 Tax=Mesorhizobium sp. TaxID=1871066 RepID=UPI00344DB953